MSGPCEKQPGSRVKYGVPMSVAEKKPAVDLILAESTGGRPFQLTTDGGVEESRRRFRDLPRREVHPEVRSEDLHHRRAAGLIDAVYWPPANGDGAPLLINNLSTGVVVGWCRRRLKRPNADCQHCVRVGVHMNSVEVVHAFWNEVWNAHDLGRRQVRGRRLRHRDGGETISGRETFKEWIAGFLAKVDDLHLEVIESFQNDDGSQVASRWLLTGKNNGFLGTEPGQQAITMTGTAVWAVRRRQAADQLGRAFIKQLQRPDRSRRMTTKPGTDPTMQALLERSRSSSHRRRRRRGGPRADAPARCPHQKSCPTCG